MRGNKAGAYEPRNDHRSLTVTSGGNAYGARAVHALERRCTHGLTTFSLGGLIAVSTSMSIPGFGL